MKGAARTGTRSDDQGAAGRGRHRGRRGLPRELQPMSGANTWTTRDRRCPFDQTADPCPQGHGEIAVKGHNVKLRARRHSRDRVFVQTQQLIAGGRFPELRGRATVPMLGQLAARGWITAEARDALTRSVLVSPPCRTRHPDVATNRRTRCPTPTRGLSGSRECRVFRRRQFSTDFRASLHEVERHYAALFETAPKPLFRRRQPRVYRRCRRSDTLKTLRSLGFKRASDICRVIRSWHFGRYRATQSAEARERLTD